jgi:hypothetical protein
MFEFLQILALSCVFLGMVPEIHHNYVEPENSACGQLPFFFVWFSGAVCSTIYIIVNDIDFLVALNVYGDLVFYMVVISMKFYNIQKYKKNVISQIEDNRIKSIEENKTDLVVLCSKNENLGEE